MDQVIFLGYIVSTREIKVAEEKVKAIQQRPTPKSILEVMSFMG